jgi:hypothetical protein
MRRYLLDDGLKSRNADALGLGTVMALVLSLVGWRALGDDLVVPAREAHEHVSVPPAPHVPDERYVTGAAEERLPVPGEVGHDPPLSLA